MGDNFYATSIVALISPLDSLAAFPGTHHDLWDYDSAQTIVLFPVTKKEKRGANHRSRARPLQQERKLLHSRSQERRADISVNEVAVPTDPSWQNASSTQPVSTVEPLTPLDFVPGTIDIAKLTAAFPGIKLAPEWTVLRNSFTSSFRAMMADANGTRPGTVAHRFVYYGTRYEPTTFHTFLPTPAERQRLFLGSTFDEVTPQEGVINFGLYGATDTNTGKVKWKIRIDQPAKSGVLVAGDLVFLAKAMASSTPWMLARARCCGPSTDPRSSLHFVGGAESNPVAYMVKGASTL